MKVNSESECKTVLTDRGWIADSDNSKHHVAQETLDGFAGLYFCVLPTPARGTGKKKSPQAVGYVSSAPKVERITYGNAASLEELRCRWRWLPLDIHVAIHRLCQL